VLASHTTVAPSFRTLFWNEFFVGAGAGMNILASGGDVAIHRLIVSQTQWPHDLVSRITCFDILTRLSDWKWSTSISPDNRNFKNDFSWNRHVWPIPSNSR
jgi:hypothetical protein